MSDGYATIFLFVLYPSPMKCDTGWALGTLQRQNTRACRIELVFGTQHVHCTAGSIARRGRLQSHFRRSEVDMMGRRLQTMPKALRILGGV